MKSIITHYKKAATYFLLFVSLLALTTSCQDEEMIVENPPPEETIVADSTLTTSMRNMAINELEVTTEAIDCIDFVYPISFSIYNTEFVIIDTVVINNAQELLVFLASLGINPNQIVSLNFPVSLEKADGTILVANNNAELLSIIITALMECDAIIDPMNDCLPLLVEANLQQCFWYPEAYDTGNFYEYNHFTFINDSVYRMSAFGYQVENKYDTYDLDEDTYIRFRENQTPILGFITGEWAVLECEQGGLLLSNTENNIEMTFTQDCGLDLAGCYGSGEGICDDDLDGFVDVDFNAIAQGAICDGFENYTISFHLTRADAEAQINPLPSPYTTTVAGTQFFYYAIVENTSGLLRYVSVYQIDAEDCGTGCENPGELIDGLIVYVPFGNEVRELISDVLLSTGGVAANFVEDRDGNPSCAIAFEAGDVPILIPGTPENEIQGDFSISLWFKMQNDEAGDLEFMFSTQQHGQDGMELGVFDLNTPLFIAYNPPINLWDNDWNQQVDVMWDNTDWHHLVITHEGSTTKMYRDGILRNESDVDINLGGATDTGYLLNAQNFRGHLDDFRLYNRGLNPNEIFQLNALEGDCYTCLD